MPHTTELRVIEELSNEQFAIHIFCCGEHEFRKTIGPEVEDVDASIQEGHVAAMKSHDAKIRLKNHLKSLEGSKVEHQ